MQKPNFFIVGQPKSGTTIIHHYLSFHKDIFLTEIKEPGYFSTDLHRESDKYNNKKRFFPIRKKKEYLNLYKNVRHHKIVGEATPNYIFSKEAPKNIFNFNKNAKILCLLRDPLSFIESSYYQSLKVGQEFETDFINALNLEDERKKGKKLPKILTIPYRLYYTDQIKYSDHLKRYLKYFNREQIKIVIYEEFKNNNQKTVNEITSFLNIGKITIKPKKLNVKSKPRFLRLNKILFNSILVKKIKTYLPKSLIRFFRFLLKKVNPSNPIKKRSLPQHEVTRLKKQFKPEVVKINDLLHKHNLIDPKIDLVKYRGYDKV